MIHVIASIHVNDGRIDEFIEIFKSNMPFVLQEKGCLEYVPAVDLDSSLPLQELNANVVTIIEKWDTLDDLFAHLKAPHMVSYHAKTREMVKKVSIKVLSQA